MDNIDIDEVVETAEDVVANPSGIDTDELADEIENQEESPDIAEVQPNDKPNNNVNHDTEMAGLRSAMESLTELVKQQANDISDLRKNFAEMFKNGEINNTKNDIEITELF